MAEHVLIAVPLDAGRCAPRRTCRINRINGIYRIMATAPSDDTARSITARLVRGDVDALAELYEARFDWMVGLLRQVTRRDEAFVLDCVQDAWVRIARRPVECPDAARLDAWLRRVALACAVDRLRSDGARALRERSAAAVETIETVLTGIDAAQRALDALDPLDHESTGLLLMRYRAGMTVQQIARALGVGPTAIDSRLRRTLSRLRAVAADSRPDAPQPTLDGSDQRSSR